MKISLKTDKETILKILKESDINKKLKVFDRLGELGEKDRTKILLKVLEDGSWCLRERAANELVKSGTKVVPRLIRICERGFWFSRAAACRALGEIYDYRAVNTLVRLLLTDENPTVVKEALDALLKMAQKAPEEILKQLESLLTQKSEKKKIMNMIEQTSPDVYNRLKNMMGDMSEK